MTREMGILIADDYEIAREGLRAIVERQRCWEVCVLDESGNSLRGKEDRERAGCGPLPTR